VSWHQHRRIGASVVVGVVTLGAMAVACGGQSNIGSQSDLDSILASAGTPRPVDTIELGGSTIDLTASGGDLSSAPGSGNSPSGTAAGNARSGGASSGGGGSSDNGASGGDDQLRDPSGSVVTTLPQAPVVVDTNPDEPTTAFCVTLSAVLGHLATDDLKQGAQDILDDSGLIDRLKLQSPADGAGPIEQLLQAIHNLANGVTLDSPLVTVPLTQFTQWAGHNCPLER
jgi:hypothetical protein